MANQNNYDNYPTGAGRDDPYARQGYGTDPRYVGQRPQGYAPRGGYPEPTGYSAPQGYPGYDRGYDRRPADPYGDYGRGYGRPADPGRNAYDPYGGRGPAQDPYGRGADPYARPQQPAYDPYEDPYGYDEGGFDEMGPEEGPQPGEEPEGPRGFAFKVRNLTKDYDGNVVLNNISFDIPAGKIVGLLGPNGCGKTTLIKILAGLIHDYTGMIKIGGKPVGISSKESLAYLPDRTYFPERFRTIDCIDYFADFFKDFDKIKAIEFASRFGLDLHQRIKTMSKGMQEKLQLLVVMSRAADIYLLDEPLGGVDPAARGVILDIIMSNYKKNATVVLSTHQVNDLEHSFDHVLMLGHGQVLVNTGIETLRSTGKSVEDIFKEVIGDAWEVE
jgi:ABC-2 type transport system ATP-binding protein